MKIFIDSANLNEIEESLSWGIIDGITTNPSLIKKAISGKNILIKSYIEKILILASNKPVSLEIDGQINGKISDDKVYTEAKQLYSTFKNFNSNLNIKIPINFALDSDDKQFGALNVIRRLESEGVPINVTLVMSSEQALLAAKVGASYISPFIGRIDDYVKENNVKDKEKKDNNDKDNKNKNNNNENDKNYNYDNDLKNGIELIKDIMIILQNYNFSTKIIGASIRNVKHVQECAKLGTHIVTIPFNILKLMVHHKKTSEGVQKFKEDVVKEYQDMLK